MRSLVICKKDNIKLTVARSPEIHQLHDPDKGMRVMVGQRTEDQLINVVYMDPAFQATKKQLFLCKD